MMPILSKADILTELRNKNIIFTPELDQFQVQPNSIDLRLGTTFYIPKSWEYTEKGRCALQVDYLDTEAKQENFKLLHLKPGQFFEILPNEFVIASTYEKIEFKAPTIIAIMYARSSMIRRGIIIESGLIDVGYHGYLMIPIINGSGSQIIRLYPGERICQLIIETVTTAIPREDAKLHGLSAAKYEGSTPYSLESRTDNQDEITFLKSGKLVELKERFKIMV